MKRIKLLIILTIIIASCGTKIAATRISFKEVYSSYVDGKHTEIKYTDEEIPNIDLYTTQLIVFTGKLFDNNHEIRNGNVYVKDTKLDALQKLPPGSIGRVLSSTDIERSLEGYIESMKITIILKDKNVQYSFWVKRATSADFYLDLKRPMEIIYNGETHVVTAPGSYSGIEYYLIHE